MSSGRTERLVGREREMGLLEDALSGVIEGHSEAVLIGGEAGVGKSRLLREALGAPMARGYGIMLGHCLELSAAGLPYMPLREAFRGVARTERSTAAEPVLRLLSGAGDGDASQSHVELFEAILTFLIDSSEETPFVLAIEDLHWADGSTLDLLAYLTNALVGERVALLMTYRTDELHRNHPLRPWLDARRRAKTVTMIEVDRLDREDTRTLIKELMGDEPSEPFVDGVFGRSEGNPFFAEELIAAEESGSTLPPSLKETLSLRLASLGREPSATAAILSVAAEPLEEQTLAAVRGTTTDAVIEDLKELVDRKIVETILDGRYRFHHALMAQAMRESLLPGEMANLHRTLAATLEDSGSDDPAILSQIADHYYAAQEPMDAARTALSAAAAEERSFAYQEALTHLERVLMLWNSLPDPTSLGVDEVEVLERAGKVAHLGARSDRAFALLQRATTLIDERADKTRSGVIWTQLGEYAMHMGSYEPGRHAFARALELLAAEDAPLERARALSSGGLHAALLGRASDGEALGAEAVELARAANDGAQECAGLLVLGLAKDEAGAHHEAREIYETAIGIARENDEYEVLTHLQMNLGTFLNALGEFEAGMKISLAAAEEAAANGLRLRSGLFLQCNAAESMMSLGRWDEAEEIARRVLKQGVDRWDRSSASLILAEVCLRRGDIEGARRAANQIDTRDIAVFRGWAVTLEVDLLIAEGRNAEAIDLALERIGSFGGGLEAGLTLVRSLRASGDLATTNRARGDEAGLRNVLAKRDELLERGGFALAPDGPLRESKVLAPLAATCAAESRRAEGQDEDWDPAIEGWRSLGAPYMLAYCLWRKAESEFARRAERAGAEATLKEAWAFAEKLGAIPLKRDIAALARRARVSLVTVEGEPSQGASARTEPDPVDEGPSISEGDGATRREDQGTPTFGLTERELEVLRLIAVGNSNKQIAEGLFISPKTASAHVSHILAKLQARSRVEAASIALRSGLIPPTD